MHEEMKALNASDTFQFACHAKISCFNHCCRDLNQFLTPYDILRLKINLSLSSSEFLDTYTYQQIGPETGLPVISLKPHSHQLLCPFSQESGCQVYLDRPASCRTYPLARIAAKSKETGELIENYILMQEPHCSGFKENTTQTVNEWIENQGIADYNQMNDLLLEIIGLKRRLLPGPLDIKKSRNFYMACYDIDKFKVNVFENGLLDHLDIDETTLDASRKDETELLKLGLEWFKQELLHL